MGADDGTHVGDQLHLGPEAVGQHFLQELRVLQAVAVGDEHRVMAGVHGQLAVLVRQGLDGGPAAPDLEHGDQVAGIVHMEHGLDVQQSTHEGGRRADPAAPLQVDQIVHGEPVTEVEAGVLHEFGGLLQAGALPLLLHGEVHQQAEAGGGGEGVHHQDLPVRVLLHQSLGSHGAGVYGGAEAGGKADVEDVLALFYAGLKGLLKDLHVGRCGAGHAAASHSLIELGKGQVEVAEALLVLVKLHGQADKGHLPLLQQLRRNVTGGICKNHVICHGMLLFVIGR